MAGTAAAVLSLVSGVLFILALGGFANPATARRAYLFGLSGMGMAIAGILVLARPSFGALLIIILGFAIGGGAGSVIAGRIAIKTIPRFLAAVQALVGLAAVMVAAAVLDVPGAFGINAADARSLVMMSIGAVIGAMTFAGSAVVVSKLDGRAGGEPARFPSLHLAAIGLGIAAVACVTAFAATQSPALFWLAVVLALGTGALLIVPIDEADMPVVASMLSSLSGWATAATGFALQNVALIITGALVGSSGAVLSSILCRSMNRSLIDVLVARKTAGAGDTAARPRTDD